ncbi:MAG: glycerophosphodiester phosphodiesterase family protein [Planctomycetota bacterium]|nr:glycerophosphodiester phosphodiesterase family protein [Planctomycetota bacterium]
MLPIVVPDNFRIIAHRGASAYAPENTFAAFELAVKMGVHEVELDTQLSTDGEVVLCHDLTLERYGHGRRTVEEMACDDLLSLDMGSWFSPFLFAGEKMITLDALFNQYSDTLTYHVEIKGKNPALPEAVTRLIGKHGLAKSCIITSFSYDALTRIKRANPRLRLSWLVDEIADDVLVVANEFGLFQICPRAGVIVNDATSKAHRAVPEVRAWGLGNSPADALELIPRVLEAGCDGMTINWPDWVVHESHL